MPEDTVAVVPTGVDHGIFVVDSNEILTVVQDVCMQTLAAVATQCL
jgi:hypothetical protein